MADSPSVPHPSSAPEPKRRRHWLLKTLLVVFALLVALVLAAPTLMSTGMARKRVEEGVSKALGVPVQIRDYSLGWLSGFEMEGLVIPNPDGYPSDRPALVLEKATGDLSFTALLRGRVSFAGSVEGLKVDVRQKADGSSNLQDLFQRDGSDRRPSPKPDRERDRGGDEPIRGAERGTLERVRLDARLVDAQIEIHHEQEGLVESLRKINAMIGKDYGGSEVKLELSAELHDPKQPDQPGALKVTADVDGTLENPVVLDIDVTKIDLARYRPLIAAFMGKDQVTAFAGVLRGQTKVQVDVPAGKVDMGGNLQIEAPQFAGPLLQGLDVAADRWVIQPKMQVDLNKGGDDLPRVNLEGFMVDLGFLRVDAVSADDAKKLVANDAAVGLSYTLDLGRIAAMGGPIPAEFANLKGTSKGTIALALTKQLQDTDRLIDNLRELIHVDTSLGIDQMAIAGFEIEGLAGALKIVGGAVDFSGSAKLEDGPATLTAKTNLGEFDADLPAEFGLSWKGGKVGGNAVRLTRYVLPLLAGVDPDAAGVDFNSAVDLGLSMKGPLLGFTTERAAQYLSEWSGAGNFELKNGSFAPAAQFSNLLNMVGAGGGKLSFSDVSGKFKLAKGYVETEALELVQKAAKLGLSGRTGVDGTIDYSLDLSEALRGRKDGEKILKLLGGSLPAAKLGGTLTAPTLGLPDIGDAVKKAAGNALGNELKKGIEKAIGDKGGDLLKKGLGGLLGGDQNKGKDGKDEKKPGSNPVEDAVKKGLGELFGGRKKK